MYAHLRTGVPSGQICGRHAAVPEGDGSLFLIHGNRITEEAGAAGQLTADKHGQRAVGIRLAARGNAVGIQKGQHRANRRAELGEEIRPAAGADGTDLVLSHIALIGFIEPGEIHDVVLRDGRKSHDGLLCLGHLLLQLLLCIALGSGDQLPSLDGLQGGAEYAHHLGIQRPAEAEALRCMADGHHLQLLQRMPALCRPDHGTDLGNHLFLSRCTENVLKLLRSPEGGDGIGSGIRAGQAVEAKPCAVDHRLPQGPENDRTVKALQHLAGVGRIGKGDVLKNDKLRLDGVQILLQISDGQQHLLRYHAVLAQALQHGNRLVKLVLGTLQMEGTDTHRNVCNLKSHSLIS